MEIREFFIIAFNEAQPLGEQTAEPLQHLSFVGYLREDPRVTHRLTISEHLAELTISRMELPGKKLRRMGRFLATTMEDPTGELRAANERLFTALREDGYICSRSNFYGTRFTPHVSAGLSQNPKKLESFDFNNLSVTESRFDLDYTFLGSEVLYTRSF